MMKTEVCLMTHAFPQSPPFPHYNYSYLLTFVALAAAKPTRQRRATLHIFDDNLTIETDNAKPIESNTQPQNNFNKKFDFLLISSPWKYNAEN